MEKNMVEHSKEFEQFKQILVRFDENLQERALKSEISSFLTELRTYCKDKHFQ